MAPNINGPIAFQGLMWGSEMGLNLGLRLHIFLKFCDYVANVQVAGCLKSATYDKNISTKTHCGIDRRL